LIAAGKLPDKAPVVTSAANLHYQLAPINRCTKGKPCGNSCIAKDKVCHK
jgi:hypothetical protein